MKKLFAVALLMLTLPAFAAAEKIGWKDLIPEGFTPPPVKPQSYYDANPEEDRQTNLDAPVVEALDGKKVRIPGYVVQLEGDADNVTEFLLVPYFGACIHVPPPPPNQIIHVKYAEGVPYENTYDAVWIEGTIKVERKEGDLAVVGYQMEADNVEVYN
ncbi:DUF3299 domain-containing protein [Idiomarina sp. PL1-037]|uniref:DUF3299 domain-containing protein n=1 Tax=Idiomarina TaxID=135575 RepID=UPI00294B4B23|nr:MULTISPECIES: DUF3299 domain-containing protein [unclassified Idiomarina]MDV6327580.1 DUF3299 domain-containing protein [Idiomarina sp. Sol25]WQC52679.1 DUF3299 domain-containing protein [Idiomarina sp. PL1-037]